MAELPVTLMLVAVFLSVALLSGTLAYMGLQSASPVRRRVRELERADAPMTGDAGIGRTAADDPMVKKVATFVPKSPKEMSRVQKRLALAGLYKPRHLATYMIAEVALPIALFGAIFLLMGWSGIIFAGLAAVVGYLIPSIAVDRLTRKRQKEIQNGLPDALDLLIVSLEAGLAIDQAILKCAEELQVAYPALAEELHMINVEGRAGKPRIECFRNFSKRTKVEDVQALVAMLVQTDRFGTSIAQALRTYAEVSRTKRRQRAEEKAAKIAVKLVFPLVFFLFPAFFIVVLGSGVIKFMEVFGDGGAFGAMP